MGYDVWTNLLRVENVHATVPCDYSIPSNTQQFSLRTKNNDLCAGIISDPDGDRFHMDFIGECDKSTTHYTKDIVLDSTVSVQQTTRFFCLASFEDKYRNRFLVTKSRDSIQQANITLLCWYISHNQRVAYWLPVGNCDSSSELMILSRRITPYATLYFDSSSSSRPILIIYVILTLKCILDL